jgi:hypothetical protein
VLLFVTSFYARYQNRSDDPIFPARNHIIPDPTGDPDIDDINNYWTNEEPHGAVLGCVEYAELCRTPSNDSCFDPWTDTTVTAIDDETYAAALGLLHSGYWPTIKTWISEELDATRKIIDVYISMPIAAEQWKLEAQRIFESSIVRAKLEVLELARGTRAGMQNFTDIMLDEMRGLCQKIKFQATGYKNLSVVGLLFAFLAPPLLAFPIGRRRLFLWPIYGIWKLGELSVMEKPLIYWPWAGIKVLGRG